MLHEVPYGGFFRIIPGSDLTVTNGVLKSNEANKKINTIVFTCCDPNSTNFSWLVQSFGSCLIIQVAGGFILSDQAQEPCAQVDEAMTKSSFSELFKSSECSNLQTIVTCAHSNCRLLKGDDDLEQQVIQQLQWLDQYLPKAERKNELRLIGCVYDHEYDWLSVYDPDTGLFVPRNAHCFFEASASHLPR
ncbi:MAG: hypothetical protein K2W82_12280 [Candidatus Obscuribacterales bacterium]|nr:hypothetical protein [Candidatus Obscuribacterales bacterium]